MSKSLSSARARTSTENFELLQMLVSRKTCPPQGTAFRSLAGQGKVLSLRDLILVLSSFAGSVRERQRTDNVYV
jgi:hypothetical protein